MAGKVTLASLDAKLDGCMELLKQHMEDDTRVQTRLLEALDGNGKPGIKTRIELAEQRLAQHDEQEIERKKHRYALWTVSLGAMLAAMAEWIIK